MRIRYACPLIFAAFLAPAVIGCGGASDTLDRKEVTGTITLNGQPLNDGRIQFTPLREDAGTIASGEIKNGKYLIPVSVGPVPGGYKVMVFSSGPAPPPVVEQMPGDAPPQPPAPELIPPQYNATTTLNAEVKSSGPNTFDFDLKK